MNHWINHNVCPLPTKTLKESLSLFLLIVITGKRQLSNSPIQISILQRMIRRGIKGFQHKEEIPHQALRVMWCMEAPQPFQNGCHKFMRPQSDAMKGAVAAKFTLSIIMDLLLSSSPWTKVSILGIGQWIQLVGSTRDSCIQEHFLCCFIAVLSWFYISKHQINSHRQLLLRLPNLSIHLGHRAGQGGNCQVDLTNSSRIQHLAGHLRSKSRILWPPEVDTMCDKSLVQEKRCIIDANSSACYPTVPWLYSLGRYVSLSETKLARRESCSALCHPNSWCSCLSQHCRSEPIIGNVSELVKSICRPDGLASIVADWCILISFQGSTWSLCPCGTRKALRLQLAKAWASIIETRTCVSLWYLESSHRWITQFWKVHNSSKPQEITVTVSFTEYCVAWQS